MQALFVYTNMDTFARRRPMYHCADARRMRARLFGDRDSNNLAIIDAAWDESTQRLRVSGTSDATAMSSSTTVSATFTRHSEGENGRWRRRSREFRLRC